MRDRDLGGAIAEAQKKIAEMVSLPEGARLDWVGEFALFGISVMNGILVLSQFNRLVRNGMERTQAILQAGTLQIRPVLMTCVIAGVGLLPAALSTGIGSQVQKPPAIVVVSGMTLAPVLILLVLPSLIALFQHRTADMRQLPAEARPAE